MNCFYIFVIVLFSCIGLFMREQASYFLAVLMPETLALGSKVS